MEHWLKTGLVLGYQDARDIAHKVVVEDNPAKILSNAARITLLAPAGFAVGPTYLACKGAVYVLQSS